MTESGWPRWDGHILSNHLNHDSLCFRRSAFDAAEREDWVGLFCILESQWKESFHDRGNLNFVRPDEPSHYTFLHHAAAQNASIQVVERLLLLGHFRSIRDGAGERPVDIARRLGHNALIAVLEPVMLYNPPRDKVGALQSQFHKLLLEKALVSTSKEDFRLPPLELLLEREDLMLSFFVPFMTVNFRLQPVEFPYAPTRTARDWLLLTKFYDRMGDGVEHDYVITPHGSVLLNQILE